MNNLGCDIEDIRVDASEQAVQPVPQIRIVPFTCSSCILESPKGRWRNTGHRCSRELHNSREV